MNTKYNIIEAIRKNKELIKTSKSPHERDQARARIKILRRKLK